MGLLCLGWTLRGLVDRPKGSQLNLAPTMRSILLLTAATLTICASPLAAQSISPSPPGATPGAPSSAPSPVPETAAAPAVSRANALTAASELHKDLARRNGAVLSRGQVCAQLVREGKLVRTATAQYRCILGG